jgi:hypothetical protein
MQYISQCYKKHFLNNGNVVIFGVHNRMDHATNLGSRDGNGSGLGRVDRKPDPRKNIIGLNLTSEPAPAGEI